MIHSEIKDIVLLNTAGLSLNRMSGKLRNKLIEPFRVIEKAGIQSYKCELPTDWRIQPVFHISLLKQWSLLEFWQESSNFEADELEFPDKTIYEIEKVLRRSKIKLKNRTIREFLTV